MILKPGWGLILTTLPLLTFLLIEKHRTLLSSWSLELIHSTTEYWLFPLLPTTVGLPKSFLFVIMECVMFAGILPVNVLGTSLAPHNITDE